ncbi:MAG: hypothetical protein II872_05415 [Clostridia bacterium]|nr:hypothetical protein [Clostridia bacterium]
MNQKKIIRTVVFLICLFMLLGCTSISDVSEQQTPKNTPHRVTPAPTENTLSDSERKSEAIKYVKSHYDDLAFYALDGLKSVSNVEIASMEIKYGSVIVKGNFWGLDAYGTVVGKYVFDWKINFDKSGNYWYTTAYRPDVTKKY